MLGKLTVPGVLLIWIIVEQAPIALAIGAGGIVFDIFPSSFFSLFFLSLWETARYRRNTVSKGRLTQNNQSINV